MAPDAALRAYFERAGEEPEETEALLALHHEIGAKGA